MPRLRASSCAARHAALGDAALAWRPDALPSRSPGHFALDAYAVKHGVLHLLALNRTEHAVSRLLDLHFKAALLDAYPNFVQPLRHWRRVGLDRANEFERVQRQLPDPNLDLVPLDLIDAAGSVSSFLRAAGMYRAATSLAPWTLQASERTLGPEHPSTLTSVNNLAMLLKAQGNLDDAAALFRRALEARERTLGPELSLIHI